MGRIWNNLQINPKSICCKLKLFGAVNSIPNIFLKFTCV